MRSSDVVVPELTHSERRLWRLHCQFSTHLTRTSLEQWLPTIERNLERLRNGVRGEPDGRNLDRWRSLIDRRDVLGLHRVLTGLDRDSIEMREVSPMGGLPSQDERMNVLQMLAGEFSTFDEETVGFWSTTRPLRCHNPTLT